MLKLARSFFAILALCALSCAPLGAEPGTDESSARSLDTAGDTAGDPAGGPKPGGTDCGSGTPSPNVVGTWDVTNHGLGQTGKVTFKADGTYTVHSGTYSAGGTWMGRTSGTYKALPGGAIAFTYTGSTTVSRIALIRCATRDRIVHALMGHTHDYEELVRARP